MANKTYLLKLEVIDSSESSGEDIEEFIEQLFLGELPEGLPPDLSARVVEFSEEE